MPTYLVRLKEHMHNPGDLVGIFVADDVDELAEYVDECCDTFECEYTELPNGGIYLPQPALPVPYDIPEDGDGDFFKGASLCDPWFRYLVGSEDIGDWESLAETDTTPEEREVLLARVIEKLSAQEAPDDD